MLIWWFKVPSSEYKWDGLNHFWYVVSGNSSIFHPIKSGEWVFSCEGKKKMMKQYDRKRLLKIVYERKSIVTMSVTLF